MDKRPLVPEDLYRLTFVGSPALDPQGRRLVYTQTRVDPQRRGYRTSLWMLDLDQQGRPAVPLTLGHGPRGEPVRDQRPAFRYDGLSLYFVSDRLGHPEVWELPLDGGEPEPLGSLGGGRILAMRPSPREEAVLVVVRPAPPREGSDVRVIRRLRYRADGEGMRTGPRHLYLLRRDAPPQLLSDPEDDVLEAVWSHDGRQVYYTCDRRPEAEMELLPQVYAVDVQGGPARRVWSSQGPFHDLCPSPDKRALYAYGHQAGEDPSQRHSLWRLDLATGKAEDLLPQWDGETGVHVVTDSRDDLGYAGPTVLEDGSVLFVGTWHGRVNLWRLVPGQAPQPVGGLLDETVSSYAAVAGRAVVTAATLTSPGELYLRSLAEGQAPGRVLTHANPFLEEEAFVARAERVTAQAPDGQETEGWLLRPPSPARPPYPLVLEVHGGPHMSYGHAFFLEFQILVGHGYAVLFTNPRGSAGYGADFRRACVGDWGGGDRQDLLAHVDRLVQAGVADPSSLGITGGSYGGFMTNWMVTQTTRFRAAVTQRSISNLHSMYGTSDIGFWFNRQELGGLDVGRDDEAILARSPIRYVDRVRTPILILHAEEDYRCPVEQAEQWFAALRRRGVETMLVRFPGEGHEMSRSGRPDHRVERLTHILGWFVDHIPPAREGAQP